MLKQIYTGTIGLVVLLGVLTVASWATGAKDPDSLAMFDGPKVEVHLSNNDRREEFRRVSMTAGVSDGSIAGFGIDSFLLGLDAAHRLLTRRGNHGTRSKIATGDVR